MHRHYIILVLCIVAVMLGCTSKSATTPTHSQTQPTSDQEVIGIIQAYLESRIISVVYLSGISGSDRTYSHRNVDCRNRALQLMDKWEATLDDNRAWIVRAFQTPEEGESGLTWEWHMFPSGVITTVTGPC